MNKNSINPCKERKNSLRKVLVLFFYLIQTILKIVMKGLQLINHGLICFNLHYQFGNKTYTTIADSCTNSEKSFIVT